MSKSKPQQPKVRSHIAVAAHMRNSAGAMGKHGRARRKAERAGAKQSIRKGDHE